MILYVAHGYFFSKFISEFYTLVLGFFRKSICCFSPILFLNNAFYEGYTFGLFCTLLQQCLRYSKNSTIFADNSTRFQVSEWFLLMRPNSDFESYWSTAFHSVPWPDSVFLMLC